MNSLLKSDLLGLKSKLENIEKVLEIQHREEVINPNKIRNLDEEVEELLKSKDSIITLNVGGEIFQTKSSTLTQIKDTLFSTLVGKSDKKSFFFDRSYHFFPLILDYLRTKKYNLKGMSKYDLEDLNVECEYYGLREISEQIAEMQKEIEFVSFEGSGRYSNAGTHSLEGLSTDKSLTKGICVQSPYHIIIELNYEHEIESMEIGGWNGNSSLWYVGNGSGAQVYTSTDKSNWKLVGTVSSLSATITTIPLTPSVGKYIKFQHSSYLGIGYLKLHRKSNK